MIGKSQPLSDFLAQYREVGLDVRPFKTRNGKRYALRLIDPDEPNVGLAFVAAFSSKLAIADRPSTKAAQSKATRALDSLLHDDKQLASFLMCYCVVDKESLKLYPDKYTEENLGQSYYLVTGTGKVDADADFEPGDTNASTTAD